MTTRFVVLPDIHVPFVDTAALRAAFAFMDAFKPQVICQLGDLLDAYSLSSHEKGRQVSLQAEIDEAVEILEYTRARHPLARMAWVEGNHEERLSRYLRRNARALDGVDGIGWRHWLQLDRLKIESYRYGDAFQPFGDWVLRIEHGHKVSKAGPGRAYLQEYRCCGISGHTHRIAKTWATDARGALWWLECGHLADLEVGEEYVRGVANWQSGIAAGWYNERDGVHAWGLPIVNGAVQTIGADL